MSYYVSIIDGPRKCLALGPFQTHGEALARVDAVHDYVTGQSREAIWYGYGTCQNRAGREPGKLNEALSHLLTADMPNPDHGRILRNMSMVDRKRIERKMARD